MIIGDRLKELRKDKRITQAGLAKVLNTQRSTISAWENQISSPSDEMKLKMAKFFNVSLDYLMGLIKEDLPYTRENVIVLPRGYTPEMKEDLLYLYDMVNIKYGLKRPDR